MEKFEVKNWLKRLDEKISHLIKKANLDNLLCLIEELEKNLEKEGLTSANLDEHPYQL